MKSLKLIFVSILILVCYFQVFSNQASTQYSQAYRYLEERGEVDFIFYVNSISEVDQLIDIMSIDKVEGNKVVANANREEFEKFLKFGYAYEVLIPDILQGAPYEMYEGPKEGERFDYTKYPTFDAYCTQMKHLETTYPNFVRLDTAGVTTLGRPIIFAKVSDNVGIKEHEAEFEIKAAIHGNEIGAWIVVLRFIDFLCSNYGIEPRATEILDTFELWICPLHNVDGTYKSGLHTVSGATRRNANNVDLNRNYPKVPGAGNSMVPEQETKVMMALEDERNFVMNIDYHHGSEVCIYPYSAVEYHTQDEDWWRVATRVYADTTQYYTTSSGYFDAYDNGIVSGRDWHSVVIGSTKDYFYYFQHVRGISLEIKNDDSPIGSSLENLFWWNVYSIMAYMREARFGIRGNVTDSISGVGLKAKVWVNGYDEDSSFVYADSSGGHGNYYRPIINGTYDVTYSCPGCESKTVQNIQVENHKATVVNVQLDCGTTESSYNSQNASAPSISIVPFQGGIKINCVNTEGIIKAAVYNVQGKLINTLIVKPRMESKNIVWDGFNNNAKKVGNGCYVLHIQSREGIFVKSFMISN